MSYNNFFGNSLKPEITITDGLAEILAKNKEKIHPALSLDDIINKKKNTVAEALYYNELQTQSYNILQDIKTVGFTNNNLHDFLDTFGKIKDMDIYQNDFSLKAEMDQMYRKVIAYIGK